MKIKSKHIALLLTLAVAILAFVVVLKNVSHHPPYQPLDEQLTSLKNKPVVIPSRLLDSSQIVGDLKFLSSDSCEGRQPGTEGHDRAVNRILQQMRKIGLDSFNSSLLQIFTGKEKNRTKVGQNIIGYVKGTTHPGKYIVISAHYDHIGKTVKGEIYHGASDNASGTACLLAMAKYFKEHPHPYSLIFAAFDREESGEEGSFYFVEQAMSNEHHLNIKFNLNIDMIARNDKNEIFACGIVHYPSFAYLVKETQGKTNVKLLMGHDTGNRRDNWTNLSDHYPFHLEKIPFLYIGVEDHPDYHKTTDTFDKIDLGSYIENCNMILLIAQILNL